MKRSRSSLVVAGCLILAVAACHNTFEGVKADTRHDLDKTGHALQKAGDKIDSHEAKDGG